MEGIHLKTRKSIRYRVESSEDVFERYTKATLGCKEKKGSDEGHELGGWGCARVPDLGDGLVVGDEDYALSCPLVPPSEGGSEDGEQFPVVDGMIQLLFVPSGLSPSGSKGGTEADIYLFIYFFKLIKGLMYIQII